MSTFVYQTSYDNTKDFVNYNVPAYTGCPPGYIHQMTHQATDTNVVKTAIQKLQTFCLVSIILSALAVVSGAVTLGFAAENIGFPVFNFGPLLVGLVYFAGNMYGYTGCRKLAGREITPEMLSSAKCPAITVFVVSVTCITFSVMSAVFAFLSGAVCAGADIDFYSRNGNIRRKIDVKQHCYPNDTANTVMGFLNGGLCIIIALWCIVGCIFFCRYGRFFGIKSRNNC